MPHLHFSFFTAGMDARNPMHPLLGWLHRAEHRAGVHPSNGHGVPTPPVAELAAPPEMHPRPAMVSAPWAAPRFIVATAPSAAPVNVPVYAAIALLLVPIVMFAASRRARSWVLGRVAA